MYSNYADDTFVAVSWTVLPRSWISVSLTQPISVRSELDKLIAQPAWGYAHWKNWDSEANEVWEDVRQQTENHLMHHFTMNRFDSRALSVGILWVGGVSRDWVEGRRGRLKQGERTLSGAYLSLHIPLDAMGSEILIISCDDRWSMQSFLDAQLMGNVGRVLLGRSPARQ